MKLYSKIHNFSSLKKLIHITPYFTVINTSICISATSFLLTNKKRRLFYPLCSIVLLNCRNFLSNFIKFDKKRLEGEKEFSISSDAKKSLMCHDWSTSCGAEIGKVIEEIFHLIGDHHHGPYWGSVRIFELNKKRDAKYWVHIEEYSKIASFYVKLMKRNFSWNWFHENFPFNHPAPGGKTHSY